MWHFGKYGFTSAVAYDPTKDRNKTSKFREIVLGEEGLKALAVPKKDRTDEEKALLVAGASSHILVRARVKEDLEDLKRVKEDLHIETDAGADYAYRAVIERDLLKALLVMHVDDIDYDSHFKEVARDHGKGATGRYTAMMSVWTAMAGLQPIAPWSGASWYGGGYGTSYSGKGKSGGNGYVSPFGTDAKKVTGASDAADDIEDFVKQYVASGGDRGFAGGKGPKTGFKKDDRVVGYFGAGTVLSVEPRKDEADMVVVKVDPKGNDKKGRTAKFVSNYLMPEGLPEIEDAPLNSVTMDVLYDEIVSIGDLDKLKFTRWELDDNAYELLTRLEEKHGEGSRVSKEDTNDVYDEILWESNDDEDKIKWVAEGTPLPSKYASQEHQWISRMLAAEDEKTATN